MTLRQRNYCLATWDPATEMDELRVPLCFAFVGIRSNLEAAKALGDKLNVEPRPWLVKNHWAVAFDYVVGQGVDPFKEIHMKLWEMSVMGIEFAWCTDPMPEMPPELTKRNNCFQTLEEALEAFARISPGSNSDL
ncbi:hypothetical protein SynSYN20_01595 [Synechococcus sp. SYN20]|uniref:hypothetical protein n=1 Tax=Synechococcus sp. SYN20 TaxID=1050714 RepID=UPI0016491A17|nr:hypothetical protein [Synechococcus sp. SYN20]QNJ25922.1 hypothetical protein SynSYN20_01595 [Synechococcus sp. SYN20]